jgi:hypothetical protein
MICDVWRHTESRQSSCLPCDRAKQVQTPGVRHCSISTKHCIKRLRYWSQGWGDKHRCATEAQQAVEVVST